ncbi:hypothetical protein COW36_23605 [bacterium (Candidatus Blackallbacteria) CG17_big_fil_post_rev_8_21_14_2_50_48_46]|uniref:Uncharacterized protein n=1 Tax=bacterium (Candidatus Blackallbacteria) CG17_big_fil_post_rev_8_21_14_2_50_48_46 TaxID=2014261 RepID=A0A2M7FYZ8_9BACT|nr:MAG: hypothetical protein COW64_17815 [bacterium (Candidatus Blackallbacteria) CG18_big_fil_WC_8_21_14_2_50_49_26]PIW14023.1 MAG: hypothetical protein COW36_23605 [bacterium (Candidatus Blackallbacteria) CG17_big_fil_post_rev_8_21_14_2_50_48_46]PIW46875.1 MAG: hypothetical protein COW20_14780 [bacterium (Candidatus Blackallbacteria) CG13_big_fil_rev_8_21_14_2_50_49_14]
MAEKKGGLCPIMSFRASFSKDAAVPCVGDKCAFWDDLYGKCGQIAQAERLSDSLQRVHEKLHDMMIKM